MQIYEYQTLTIDITGDSYGQYLLIATHNYNHNMWAGYIFGTSYASGIGSEAYGVRYTPILENSAIDITEGDNIEGQKSLVIKNNSASQFRVSLLRLSYTESKISYNLVSDPS